MNHPNPYSYEHKGYEVCVLRHTDVKRSWVADVSLPDKGKALFQGRGKTEQMAMLEAELWIDSQRINRQ